MPQNKLISQEMPAEPMPELSCDQCCDEIPPANSLHEEVDDMVLFFCGPECYAEWRQRTGQKNDG